MAEIKSERTMVREVENWKARANKLITDSPMNIKSFCLCCLALNGLVLTASPTSRTEASSKPRTFKFSLVPKSLQKNPEIDCNIITELTPAGKKLKPPSAKKPGYYILQPGYYQSLGEEIPAKIRKPSVADLQLAMVSALSATGYLQAEPPAHPPTLLVVFTYGDHWMGTGRVDDLQALGEAQFAYERLKVEREKVLAELTEEERDKTDLPELIEPTIADEKSSAEELVALVLSDKRKYRQLIDRAGLVGGVTFATELARALQEESAYRISNSSEEKRASRQAEVVERDNLIKIQNKRGETLQTFSDIQMISSLANGPFHHFYQKNPTKMHLIEDIFSSCFFVIASAYDGAALAKGERRLLWRTKMSVNSAGISMGDSLPSLIRSAAPYFGRETDGTVTITKRITREGKVDIGAPTVIESGVAVPNPDDKKGATNTEQDKK